MNINCSENLNRSMMKNKQQYVCEKTGRIVGFEYSAFGAEFVVDPEFLEKC